MVSTTAMHKDIIRLKMNMVNSSFRFEWHSLVMKYLDITVLPRLAGREPQYLKR
jgi:hypothetical protein